MRQREARSIPLATWGVALLLPVGPLAIAVLRLVLPYYTETDSAGAVAAVAASPGRQSAVLWLSYVGILTLVPGLIAAARVCRDAAPRLTAWALGLAVPGYLSLGMFVGADHVLWNASHAGLSGADAVAVVDAAHPSIDVAVGVFVLGHVLGTVLLGLALLRSGQDPGLGGLGGRGVPAAALRRHRGPRQSSGRLRRVEPDRRGDGPRRSRGAAGSVSPHCPARAVGTGGPQRLRSSRTRAECPRA